MLGIIDTAHLNAKPIKATHLDTIIYNKDGTMRSQFAKICEEIGISPSELTFKSLEEFKSPNISQNIQVIRYNHYENKRLAKIEALKNMVKERNPQLFSHLKTTKIPVSANYKYRSRKGSLQYDPTNRSEDDTLRLNQGNNNVPLVVQSLDTNQYGLFSKTSKTNRFITTPIKKYRNQRVYTSINAKNTYDEESDNSEDNIEDEGYDVKAALDEDFKKYLAYRAIDRERIKTAYPRVHQFEESYVDKNKKCVMTKEDKFEESIDKLEKIQKKKLKDKRQKATEKGEIILEMKQQEEKVRKEKFKKLLAKLDLSQTIKENGLKIKQDKVIKENIDLKTKIDEISSQKEEQESWDPRPYLKNLEETIQKKKEYSEYQIQQRVGTLRKHSVQVSETQKKQQDLYLQHQNSALNKVLDKYYLHSLPKPKPKRKDPYDDPKSEEYKHEHAIRKKLEQEEAYEKDIHKAYTDKKKKMDDLSLERQKKQKEFLEVKKELKNLKIEDVRENLSMMISTKEKFDWNKYENHKIKCKKINDWKQNRRNMMASTFNNYSFDESLLGIS